MEHSYSLEEVKIPNYRGVYWYTLRGTINCVEGKFLKFVTKYFVQLVKLMKKMFRHVL